MGTWVTTFDRRRLCAALLMVGLVLAACGGGAAKTAAPTQAPANATGSSPAGGAATPTPQGPIVPDDIPIIEGANIERSWEGVVEYRVAKTIQEVVDFYSTEMPAQGWDPSGSPNILSTIATLRFHKDSGPNVTVSMQYNERAQSTLVRLFWQGY